VRGAAVDHDQRAFARHLRRDATPSEQAAWALLRARRCLGLKFRRQQSILGFVVDFYCADLRVAVEIDGGIHDDPIQAAHDDRRDLALLRHAGILVLRVPASDLTPHLFATLLQPLLRALRAPLSRVPRERGVGG
jgi:very-short-patch-repair endonuclease